MCFPVAVALEYCAVTLRDLSALFVPVCIFIIRMCYKNISMSVIALCYVLPFIVIYADIRSNTEDLKNLFLCDTILRNL